MTRAPARTHPRRAPRVATALALALLPGCGLAGAGTPATGRVGEEAGGRDAARSHPVVLDNCGEQVRVAAPPERALLLTSASVPYLAALGVLDRVAARAGQYPAAYFDAPTRAALADVPVLTDELDASGHLQVSQEVVLAQEPDLVLGQVDSLPRASLAALGVPTLVEPALCPGGGAPPSFDDVARQLEAYGRVFDRPEEARRAAAEVRARLAALAPRAAAVGAGRSAAVLYPTVGGGTTYAYGTGSMAHPQLEAAGFRNAFADVDERVFEVTLEELLARDPDVLVLLHSEGDPARVRAALEDLPGAGRLRAVRDDAVLVQLFGFTEPPSPLSVEGLERIVDHFDEGGSR